MKYYYRALMPYWGLAFGKQISWRGELSDRPCRGHVFFLEGGVVDMQEVRVSGSWNEACRRILGRKKLDLYAKPFKGCCRVGVCGGRGGKFSKLGEEIDSKGKWMNEGVKSG